MQKYKKRFHRQQDKRNRRYKKEGYRGKITKYTHFFLFEEVDELTRQVLRYFIRQQLIAKELIKERGRWKTIDGKVYVLVSKDKKQLFLHVNLERALFTHLSQWGLTKDKYDYKEVDVSNYIADRTTNIMTNDNFNLFDYQEEMIAYIKDDGHRKTLALQPGMGKTLIAFKAGEVLQTRMMVVVLPRYLEKWKADVIKNCKPGVNVIILDDKKKLTRYLEQCLKHPDDIKEDIIIASVMALNGYRAMYFDASPKEQKNLVEPWMIWSVMKVGFRVTDEVHEHFHANYMIDLYTHLPKTLYLSATLDPSGRFEDEMYKTMFPKNERMGGDIYTPYINVTAVKYNHEVVENWQYMLQGRYSHTQYEGNFINASHREGTTHLKPRTIHYFEMIHERIVEKYINVKQKDQKAIIFFATVAMCSSFAKWLQSKYPDLTVSRYVSEDDYELLNQSDILVSTPGSAGTGVDIYGLIYTLLTISRRSKQQNMQMFGRLRQLRAWPGQDPEFEYLVAEDILPSMDYHLEKKILFKTKAKSIKEINTGVILKR